MSDSRGAPGIERRRMTLLTRIPMRGDIRAQADARARTGDPRLTPRQRQVLDGLIRGLANKEIGSKLHMSERTAPAIIPARNEASVSGAPPKAWSLTLSLSPSFSSATRVK